MDIVSLIANGLVAAVISGVFVFSYQQWIQARLKRVEAELERQRNYEQKTHEMLVGAYKKIWDGLVEIEDWLKRRLWEDIGSRAELEPNQQWNIIFDTYKSFRGEMLFLSEPLYQRTRNLIVVDLANNLNGLIDAVRQVIAERSRNPDGYSTDPRLLQITNDALSKVVKDYSSSLEEIRREYQSISRGLLLGELSDRQ